LRDDLRRFQWDYSTFKVDWALRGPVPWQAGGVAGAGTVHVAGSLDEMSDYAAQISTGRVPAHPFLLVGQMTTADPCRSPAGTESLWAYTHVPRQVRGDAGGDLTGAWDERGREALADGLAGQLEGLASCLRTLLSATLMTVLHLFQPRLAI